MRRLRTRYGFRFIFAREEASAPSASQSAFLSVFTHPATKQDKELVFISANASEKAYRPDDVKEYLKDLGFPEKRIKQYDYSCDADHYAALTLASREVTDEQGRTVTLYAVIVRGTKDTAEWISNFDMGGGDIALGFYLASQRVLEHLSDYIELYPPVNGASPLFWLTGHSRGAAVANLLAGQFLTHPAERVYAVTFATPNVAKSTTRAANILNFVIDGDVVTNVPLTAWGFDRHGLTVHYTQNRLVDVNLTSAKEMKILVDFLGQTSQEEYYEMTLEVLHSEVITTRNAMTLSDMLMVNVVALASRSLDHMDQTLSTGSGILGDALFNTAFQVPMRALLGDLLPHEQQATVGVIWGVIENAVTCHDMLTYLKWIECIYYDRPTTPTAPGSSGGR